MPGFYKILFEILLLYILLLNYFFISGNFIFYFLSNLIFCKSLYGHLICARGTYIWVGCAEAVIELHKSVG